MAKTYASFETLLELFWNSFATCKGARVPKTSRIATVVKSGKVLQSQLLVMCCSKLGSKFGGGLTLETFCLGCEICAVQPGGRSQE